MAAETPPLYLQGGTHPAKNFRRLTEQLFSERQGVLRTTDFVVAAKGTPNMSVDVAAGAAVIDGTEAADQAYYFVYSDDTVNLTVSASDPTNARYDLIVAQVRDSTYSGADDDWQLAVVEGTAAATPLFPTVPANSVILAVINVTASLSAVTGGEILDARASTQSDGTTTIGQKGYVSSLGGVTVCTAASRPDSPHIGMEIRETDTNRKYWWNGSAWKQEGGNYTGYTGTPVNMTFSAFTGRYVVDGKRVHGHAKGTVSAVTGTLQIPIPVAPNGTWSGESGLFSIYAVDASGSQRYHGVAKFEGGTTVTVRRATGASGDFWNATIPMTWAAGDIIDMTFDYEGA